MIRFYFYPAPNPAKVALALEETGLPYERFKFKTETDEEARRFLFPSLAAPLAQA